MKTLTAEEMERFRRACRDEGVDPMRHCPLCRCDVMADAERGTDYCDTHMNWTHDVSTINVKCGGCDRAWKVIGPITCDGADDGRRCGRRRWAMTPMTCPIAHYVDLPGYTQTDVEAGCRLARAVEDLGRVLDAPDSTVPDAAIEAYNVVCRELRPSETVMHLAFKHGELCPSALASVPPGGEGVTRQEAS